MLFNYYTGFRRALFMDCNLIDHIPTAGGFFSIYLRSSAKVSSLLNDAPNGLPEPLADFIGASQISAPDTSFTWLNRTNFMPLATAGQKPIFASPDETLKAIASPAFDPRSTVFLPLNARAFITVTNQSAPRITSRKFLAQEAQLKIEADEPAADRCGAVFLSIPGTPMSMASQCGCGRQTMPFKRCKFPPAIMK